MYFRRCCHGCRCGYDHEIPCFERGNRCVFEHTSQVDSPSVGTVADDGRFVYRDLRFPHVSRLEGADVFVAFHLPYGEDN